LTANKATVERYIAGFNATDRALILSCLADDVEWVVPGMFHAVGKEEFGTQITHEDFTGSPEISLLRLVEEDGVVVAEGTVRSRRKDGGTLNARFCDVFVMRDAKIRHLTSYLADVR
jgi:uncharacterized protein